jgi:hypothetical protein
VEVVELVMGVLDGLEVGVVETGLEVDTDEEVEADEDDEDSIVEPLVCACNRGVQQSNNNTSITHLCIG